MTLWDAEVEVVLYRREYGTGVEEEEEEGQARIAIAGSENPLSLA